MGTSSLPPLPGTCKSCLYLICFHIVYHGFLQSMCRGISHSLFYLPSMADVELRMEGRVKYAERLIGRLKKESSSGGTDRAEPLDEEVDCSRKFCVGVVGTEARLEYRYLISAVGSLRGLGGVDEDCRTDKFFVQIRGRPHDEGVGGETGEDNIDIKMMKDAGLEVDYFVPSVERGEGYYNNEGERVYKTDSSVNGHNRWFRQESDDYRKAMARCLDESDANHIVIVEEDVWATEGFMDKIDGVVKGLDAGQWTMLKLFVTDYWQNWERDPGDVAILVIGGILFACAAETITRFAQRKWGICRDDQLKKRSSMNSLGVQIEMERGMRKKPRCRCRWLKGIRWKRWAFRAYFVSLGVVTMYVVSKQALGLSEVNKRGVYTNDMGASSLGIAYPRQVAERVVEYLDMKSKEPLDVRLMKFTKKEGGGQYIVVPCLLEHTGMFSSSARKQKFKKTLNEEIFYRDHMKLASIFEDVPLEKLWEMEPVD